MRTAPLLLFCALTLAAHTALANEAEFLTNESLQKYSQGDQETDEYQGETANAEARRLADEYLRLYAAGEPEKAFKYLWNWDAFCTKAFGKAYTSLTRSDRTRAQELALSVATAAFQNKDILSAMRSARFPNQRYRTDRNGNVQLYFETLFRDGTSGGQTTLYIARTGNRYWIVDLYNHTLLSAQLGADFATAKLSLLSFLEIVRNEASKLGQTIREDWLHGTWELAYDPDNNDKDWIIFGKLGKFILRGSTGPDYEGFYSIENNRLILGIKVKDKVRTTEMAISDDRSRLTNASGAYYRRISRL